MRNDNYDSDIELFDAFLLLKNSDEVKRFLTDLCTPKEIKALKERWKVCKLLEQGDLSYRDINKITTKMIDLGVGYDLGLSKKFYSHTGYLNARVNF